MVGTNNYGTLIVAKKKEKQPEKPKYPTLYVDFNVNSYEINPPEEWEGEWLHQGDTGATVSMEGVSLKEYKWCRDREQFTPSFEAKVGDRVYVVYCTYTSGSTFGSNGGYVAVAGIFQKEETAEAARARIDAHYRHFHGSRRWSVKPTTEFPHEYTLDLKDDDGNSYDVHVSWYDYFGGLDSIELESAIVDDVEKQEKKKYNDYR